MWRFGLVEKVRKATQSMFGTMWLKADRATWPPPWLGWYIRFLDCQWFNNCCWTLIFVGFGVWTSLNQAWNGLKLHKINDVYIVHTHIYVNNIYMVLYICMYYMYMYFIRIIYIYMYIYILFLYVLYIFILFLYVFYIHIYMCILISVLYICLIYICTIHKFYICVLQFMDFYVYIHVFYIYLYV